MFVKLLLESISITVEMKATNKDLYSLKLAKV